MANHKPYYTSSDLIDAVQRKISFPISQETFSADDILKFANEEMYISQVPSVLIYHQEYFVFPVEVSLVNNVSRYQIPDRSIGLRMRDVMYKDTSGNLSEMTRVDAGDKAYFQMSAAANNSIHKFYIEGNDVVLVPQVTTNAAGSLVFYIYLRPNQLVTIDRAATLQSKATPLPYIKMNFQANSTFVQVSPTSTITIPNHGLSNGNRLIFSSSGTLPSGLIEGALYYVVNKTTNSFQVSTSIGGTSVSLSDVGIGVHTVTRTKMLTQGFLPSAIDFSTDTITIVNHDYANGDLVIIDTDDMLPTPLQANTIYYIINATSDTFQLSETVSGLPIDITYVGEGEHKITSDITSLTFDAVPSNLTAGSLVDFLQTNTGHRTYDYDVQIPIRGVSGSTISFKTTDIPMSFQIGDYVCTANECIIPQIPSDLHNGLAERTCGRILAAIGDQAGLQAVNQKIGEIEQRQGTLLDNRAEGSPQKVNARHSLLRYGRFYGRRRV